MFNNLRENIRHNQIIRLIRRFIEHVIGAKMRYFHN